MTDWRFAEPQWIHLTWAVLVLTMLLLWLDHRGSRGLEQFLSTLMHKRLVRRPSAVRRTVRILLLAAAAMALIAALMRPGAVFALSLRHGPAGAGTHVFPTDGLETIRGARACGLVTVLHLPDQPSLMAGKAGVTWTRVAFEKR